MKMRKLLLSLLLGAVLTAAAAASDTILAVNGPPGGVKAGETFTVTVDLTGTPGFSAVQFTLGHDERLTCTQASTGALLSGAMSATNPAAREGAIIAAATAGSIKGDGSLATFRFTAKADLDAVELTLSDIVLSNSAGDDISYTITGGEEKAPVLPTPSTPATTTTLTVPAEGAGEDKGQTGRPEKAEGEGEVTAEKPTASTAPSFPDIAGHWGASYIEQAAEQGLFAGFPDGTFRPNAPVSRAQLVTVLWRLDGRKQPTVEAPFADIGGQIEEFRRAIAWAYEKGIVAGRSADRFDPTASLTREEAMTVLFNYSGGQTGQEALFGQIYDGHYTDSGDIASWARAAMHWGVYRELIAGTTDTTISPKGTASRVQIAKILVDYRKGANQ